MCVEFLMRKERKSTAHSQPTVFKGWCLAASLLVFTRALLDASQSGNSFVSFQLSSRLCGFKAGPESFTAVLAVFIPSGFC